MARIVRHTRTAKNGIHIYIKKHFVKSVTSGYKIVIIFPLLSCYGGATIMTMKGAASQPPRSWQAVRSWQSVPCQFNSFSLVRYTILAKYAKMAKAGAYQKMEKPAVVVEEW